MKHLVLLATVLFLLACKPENEHKHNAQTIETVEACDNPDASPDCCFISMPNDLSVIMKITDEPGPRLTLKGKIVRKGTKDPISGAILYAYHTDTNGYYGKAGTEQGIQKWHGRLHGWCKTDNEGNYEICTVRPAPYPGGQAPAHVHAVIKLDNGKALYVNDFVFEDDTLVNDFYRNHYVTDPDPGIVTLEKVGNGFVGTRTILVDEEGS